MVSVCVSTVRSGSGPSTAVLCGQGSTILSHGRVMGSHLVVEADSEVG